MNAPTPFAEGLPRRRFSVADVLRMVEVGLISDDERLEVLGGEIVPMSLKGSRHEAIKAAINEHWGRNCPQAFRFIPETGLYLSDQTYLEPDFVVFERSVRIAELKGPSVSLAVEVAVASLDYDLGRKPFIYASFGVKELWVVDVRRRLLHAFRDPGPEGYATVGLLGADDTATPTHAPTELAFSLADLAED